ncbi:MAG: PAS domain-containing sensor histidine kinase [Ktedonobacteraceae bacterium]
MSDKERMRMAIEQEGSIGSTESTERAGSAGSAEQEQFYSLFQQVPAAIAVLKGATLIYELANPLYRQIFNRSEEQMIGKTVREVYPEIAGQGIYEQLEDVFSSGNPYFGHEFPATFDRSGSGVMETGYFNFIAQPLRNTAGQVDRIMIHAVEITEQIVARTQAEESETRFRALADNIPNLVWMANADGWIYWYNSRWYEYTGTTPEQMQGWGWQSVHDPQTLPAVLERWSSSLKSGNPFEMTFPLRRADGVFHPFLTRVTPIYDANGQVAQWFGTNTDITEQKRLEQQKDEFLGVASHELKTPLTSIKAYAQLLERRFRQGGDTRAAEMLQKMGTQLNKLTNLVDDLLDVTRIENGQLPFHPSPFDFNELIHEVVEETQRTTSRHTIVLKLDATITIVADRDRIRQVLLNLLTNAIKYSPLAKTVIVKTVCTEEAITTSVQDFGIGIPREKLEHIFERFFRVEDETQTTYPGLGLGLYISADFVRRHHGTIWAESEPGKGTTFSFSLPRRPLQ